jgi:release factor glutamine methyltransferase
VTVEESRLRVVRALAAAGCVAPAEEAEELLRATEVGVGVLDELVVRRQRGEPLAWITGSVDFCGIRVRVDRGVYVPRAHTEALARRTASLLPADGIAVDLCTGSGAVAAFMHTARPDATVLATDCDPVAIACARSNGVTAFLGDLDEPLPSSLEGRVDVMTAVVPYVPTEELHLLPRDVIAYEPRHALDGGPRGMVHLERVAALSVRWLHSGGHVLLELGGDQARALATTLSVVGLSRFRVYRDADGHERAIEAWRGARHEQPTRASVEEASKDARHGP